MITWRETIDDKVDPPEGMRIPGPVHRRTWEARQEREHVHVELTAYLGTDGDGFDAVVVRWDAVVWRYGERQDSMSSGTRLYGDLPHPGRSLWRVVNRISPSEVGLYSVWGDGLKLLLDHDAVVSYQRWG